MEKNVKATGGNVRHFGDPRSPGTGSCIPSYTNSLDAEEPAEAQKRRPTPEGRTVQQK